MPVQSWRSKKTGGVSASLSLLCLWERETRFDALTICLLGYIYSCVVRVWPSRIRIWKSFLQLQANKSLVPNWSYNGTRIVVILAPVGKIVGQAETATNWKNKIKYHCFTKHDVAPWILWIKTQKGISNLYILRGFRKLVIAFYFYFFVNRVKKVNWQK